MAKKLQSINKNMILYTIESHKAEIRKYSVRKIALFGSFLKNKQNKKSDIDLLVVFDKLSFDNYIELKFLLEKLFNKKVDLVIEENIKPALKNIKEEAVYAKGI